jgi:hypothetical protein
MNVVKLRSGADFYALIVVLQQKFPQFSKTLAIFDG